jgi:hypothetical protein
MIVFIQFPVTDIRNFLPVETGILAEPSWPAPKPYSQFVRYFGQVKRRGKGGVNGWVGENEICDAHNALKLKPKMDPFLSSRGHIKIKCAARHFYFDGIAVGKHELVLLSAPKKIQFKRGEFDKFVNYIFGLQVFIRFPNNEIIETDLYSIRKHLSKFYLLASSKTGLIEELEKKKWIIAGEEPLLYFELSEGESAIFNLKFQEVDLSDVCVLMISQQWIQRGIKLLKVISTQHMDQSETTPQNGRLMRMYLMRLHAEYETIREVSRKILEGVINPEVGTPESDALQFYLNKTTKKINKNVRKTKSCSKETDVAKMAFNTLDQFDPGTRDSLISKLKSQKLRPQVINKINNLYVKNAKQVTAEKAEIEMAEEVTVVEYQPQTWERVIVYGAALLIIGLIVFLVIRNEPIADPNFVVFIRIVLSLAVAALGAFIPGMLKVGFDRRGYMIRASGALALFVITFLLTPRVIQ